MLWCSRNPHSNTLKGWLGVYKEVHCDPYFCLVLAAVHFSLASDVNVFEIKVLCEQKGGTGGGGWVHPKCTNSM